jgi:SAM-dependent methyltransferase
MTQARPAICPFCGSSANPIARDGAVCSDCHSVFALRLPSDEELAAYYARFNQVYRGGGRSQGAKGRQQRYAARYLSLVTGLPGVAGGRLLDIGSSTSPFPNLAAAAGFDVCVLDYVRPDGLTDGIDFVCGAMDGEAGLAEPDTYDVVTAFAVIEHCRFPDAAARNMSLCCKPGGHIVLMTPSVGYFSDVHAAGYSPWFNPPEHLHLISPRGMAGMFAAAGVHLVRHGAFEISFVRQAIRWSMGSCEGLGGLGLKTVAPGVWNRLRGSRRSRVQDIRYYIFRKQP